MDLFTNDTAILLLSTLGLVITTVSIVLDTRGQAQQRIASEKIRVEA